MTLEAVRTVVELKDRSYSVVTGADILSTVAAEIAPLLGRPRVAIVTDETVGGLFLDDLVAALDHIETSSLLLPSGESTKSWDMLERVVGWLLDEKIERGDIVIAFGGGVIGDLVGFAAAILRRGVRFVQIPTSLLAQVDSSVGGKTGINARQGKNLVGAFHQPSLVLADISLLTKLSKREFLAGYGEVAKYGLLGDEAFFEWLEANSDRMRAHDPEALTYAVSRSVEIKAGIVSRDEKEHGERALLNLGHTFGHALEAATGYSDRLLHGEGVAIGCKLAAVLSSRLGLCSQEVPSRVDAHLEQMGMRRSLSDIDGDLPNAAALIELMMQDKKVVQGQARFILMRDIGSAFVSGDVDPSDVAALLSEELALRS